MSAAHNHIEIRAIKKQFGSNPVLHDINLTLTGGKILALMGANGAGKSTLVKILSGIYQVDQGAIYIDDKECSIATPQQARKAGIVTVHQIINDGVVQDLTIAENLLLDRLCDGRIPHFIDKKALHLEAQKIADNIGLQLPLHQPVAELSQADKQLVAIARAISEQPRLLILDEPTSSLSDKEAARLFESIIKLRDQNVAIIYISHRMSDIRTLADTIATLREGRIVGLFQQPLNYDAAVDSMLGHAVGEIRHPYVAGSDVRLSLQQIQLTPQAKPFDLTFHNGELVVLTGLLSSGCSSVAEGVFGMRKFHAGSMQLDGQPWQPRDPRSAISQGVFMVQEDRGNNSIIPAFSIEENVSLPFLAQLGQFGMVDKAQEQQQVGAAITRTKVKFTDQHALMSTLSGGNQQKVIIARWLFAACKVLLLNEPFQGVDIASRRQIGELLRETAQERTTIAICTDIEEALEIADRIVVFNHNNLVGIHRVDQIDIPTLIKQIAAAPEKAIAQYQEPEVIAHEKRA